MRKENNSIYEPEQLQDAERTAKVLTSISNGDRNLLIMVTNVFISGMEAGARISKMKLE